MKIELSAKIRFPNSTLIKASTEMMRTFSTKNGRSFVIRNATEKDAQNIINYSKIIFSSTDQVLTTLAEYTITVETETSWITQYNQNTNALLKIAECNDTVIGLVLFNPNTKKKISHSGEFGISVHPDFQGIRVGRLLIEDLLDWARHNTQIEKVFLNVFATNKIAIELYLSMGFIEEGRHIKAVKQLTGEYVDVIQMYLET